MQLGCVGAVVDGSLRDTAKILELGFPVWSCFRTPAASLGRWDIVDWDCEIVIERTVITPGDWVFADIDGVVIVPQELLATVLDEAEAQVDREELMRADIRDGKSAAEVVARHGAF
jgi:regulator of RNase E activity RraA